MRHGLDQFPLLPKHLDHYIGGRFVPSQSGERFANVAPATDQPFGDVALGAAEDVDAAVAAAHAAMAGPWGRSTAAGRARILRKVGDLIVEHGEELARLETMDTGKPMAESLTGDIARAAANFRFYSELSAHQSASSYVGEDGTHHVSRREPLGVVGLITPWNLPLYLATWKLAPALAQGNAVVLKPAELTPLSVLALMPLLAAAGLPKGVVNIVQGLGAESAGEALVQHTGVSAISFTGETGTGEHIMRAAAPTLKKLSFELGGKGASVIFADADIEHAAFQAARAAFRNQGQVCLAGSRLLVQRSVYAETVARVLDATMKIKLGDPLAEQTTMGSLISRDHRQKVMGYVDAGRREPGVEVLCGGRVPPSLPMGAFYEPTILSGVRQESRLIQEEIFGPVLTVQAFDDEDEALALLNGTKFGLSCSIYTQDIDRAQHMASRARMGLVWINTWFVRDLHTAFGGMKRSGLGREGGQYSLDFFSDFKTISTAVPAHKRSL